MIYLRGNIWWLQYGSNNNRCRISLHTTDRGEAVLLADARLAQRDAAKAARVAQAKLQRVGLVASASDWSWAIERWPRLNPRERQAVVFARSKGRCTYCSCEVVIPLVRDLRTAPNRAVLDHIIPVSGGGSDGFENLALACNACNLKKHDKAAAP